MILLFSLDDKFKKMSHWNQRETSFSTMKQKPNRNVDYTKVMLLKKYIKEIQCSVYRFNKLLLSWVAIVLKELILCIVWRIHILIETIVANIWILKVFSYCFLAFSEKNFREFLAQLHIRWKTTQGWTIVIGNHVSNKIDKNRGSEN